MLGVPGTGPYGRIRSLRTAIQTARYGLQFAAELHIGATERKRLRAQIERDRAEIKKILAEIKTAKR